MTITVEQAREAAWAARVAKADLDTEVREEIAAVTKAVKDRYANRLTAAWQALAAAEEAQREAENAAAADHEWEGKRVVLVEPILDRWSCRPPGQTETTRGVLRTKRHGDHLPNVWEIRSLSVGQQYVRLLKKDGTEGVKAVAFKDGRNGAKWTLAAGQ